MKNYYLLVAVTLLAVGCNPFEARQEKTKSNMLQAEKVAKAKASQYKPDIRVAKPYEAYLYQAQIHDPFRIREFLLDDEDEVVAEASTEPVCAPPACVPPEPHEKFFLENYGLDELAFVGTLSQDGNIALIKTPDLGVMRIHEGEYMGRNNGKVLVIKETAIVLQEKIFRSGLWEDKKTVLTINK